MKIGQFEARDIVYTWKDDKSAFQTATILKNGRPHLSGHKSEANEFCMKWNGRRGDFEIKDA